MLKLTVNACAFGLSTMMKRGFLVNGYRSPGWMLKEKKKQFDKLDNPEDERRQEALKMATKHKTKHNLFPVSRSNDTHTRSMGRSHCGKQLFIFTFTFNALPKMEYKVNCIFRSMITRWITLSLSNAATK